jgi:hypothetical protein
LIKINADNGATNLKDLLLSTYTVQKTDFIFLPSFFNDTIVEKNIYDHSIQYQLCTSSGQEEHHNIRRLSYPLTNVSFSL